MSRGDVVVGLALALGGAAALPALVGATSGGADLEVRAPSAYELRQGPTDESRLLDFIPSDRVTVEHSLPPERSGLDLITYGATYGGAWHRDVTWPSLVGPFAAEGSDVCGYSLRVGAGLFDTAGAGRGLRDAVIREVAKQFPKDLVFDDVGIRVHFAAVEKADFTVTLQDGRASVYVALLLADETFLSVRFPALLVSRAGSPVVVRIRDHAPDVVFRGRARDEIERQARDAGAGLGGLGGCLIGFLFGGPIGCAIGGGGGLIAGSVMGEEKAEDEIAKQAGSAAAELIDLGLSNLSLGMEKLRQPWSPHQARPSDAIKLRLAGSPSISSRAITLPLCVGVTLGSPKVDAAIPGSVFANTAALSPPDADASPTIELSMNGDALNQVMYYVWQSGMLRELGQSDLVLAGLSEKVRMAAFDFKGLDPLLPPTLDPKGGTDGALPFVLGNVEVGAVGARTVVTHGLFGLRLQQHGESIQLVGGVTDLRVNCIEPQGTSFALSPCLGDLLPVARDVAAQNPVTHEVAGGELLGKLSTIPFQGVSLRLSDLRAATSTGPARLDLAVRARIEAP